jgi:hypothetical protein
MFSLISCIYLVYLIEIIYKNNIKQKKLLFFVRKKKTKTKIITENNITKKTTVYYDYFLSKIYTKNN